MSKKPSIVVIGNGPSVLNNKYGKIIDNFDEVVRINHYKPSENVGEKLTIFVVAAWKVINYPKVPLLSKKILLWKEHNIPTPYDNCKQTETIKKEPITSMLHTKFNFNIFPKNPWCSTGIATLMYLIQSNKYDTIYIYGFDNLIKGNRLHYFEQAKIEVCQHSSELEKNFIDHYIKLGKLCKLEDSNLVKDSPLIKKDTI
jgi:hypothetical protein